MDSLAVWLQAGLINTDSPSRPVSLTPTQSHNYGTDKALKFQRPQSHEPQLSDSRTARNPASFGRVSRSLSGPGLRSIAGPSSLLEHKIRPSAQTRGEAENRLLSLSESRNLGDSRLGAAFPRRVAGFQVIIYGTERSEICGTQAEFVGLRRKFVLDGAPEPIFAAVSGPELLSLAGSAGAGESVFVRLIVSSFPPRNIEHLSESIGVSPETSATTPQTRGRSLINSDSRNLLKSQAPGPTRRFCLTISGPRAGAGLFARLRRAARRSRTKPRRRFAARAGPAAACSKSAGLDDHWRPLRSPGRCLSVQGVRGASTAFSVPRPDSWWDRLGKTRKPATAAPPASARRKGPIGRESSRPAGAGARVADRETGSGATEAPALLRRRRRCSNLVIILAHYYD